MSRAKFTCWMSQAAKYGFCLQIRVGIIWRRIGRATGNGCISVRVEQPRRCDFNCGKCGLPAALPFKSRRKVDTNLSRLWMDESCITSDLMFQEYGEYPLWAERRVWLEETFTDPHSGVGWFAKKEFT